MSLQKSKNIVVHKDSNDSTERQEIILPSFNGDQQIFLGQTIFSLIKLNQSTAYTEEMNKSFTIELINSLLQELDITHEELKKAFDDEQDEMD